MRLRLYCRAAATCTSHICCLQAEFDGVKHHMSMDRDVIISLEILAPTKSRHALQKAVAQNINSSTTAVMEKRRQTGLSGMADPYHPTAPSRPLQDHAEEAPRFRRGRMSGRAQQGLPVINYRTNSLYGFLNHTTTAAGARLLRTNLLQPLTDVTTLELRLDSLQVCGKSSAAPPCKCP